MQRCEYIGSRKLHWLHTATNYPKRLNPCLCVDSYSYLVTIINFIAVRKAAVLRCTQSADMAKLAMRLRHAAARSYCAGGFVLGSSGPVQSA